MRVATHSGCALSGVAAEFGKKIANSEECPISGLGVLAPRPYVGPIAASLPSQPPGSRADGAAVLANVPLQFEINRGQANERTRFLSRAVVTHSF